MVERSNRRQSSARSDKTKDPRTVAKFLQELSWLLDSYSHVDFRALSEAGNRPIQANLGFGRHVSKNPNIHFLVGALPIIFSDELYFPMNEDIAEFASEALRLPIPRWEKRSRYELIGLIVCETAKSNDERLTRLVNALERITSEDPNAKALLQTRKANSLSWNEVIQRLTHGTEP